MSKKMSGVLEVLSSQKNKAGGGNLISTLMQVSGFINTVSTSTLMCADLDDVAPLKMKGISHRRLAPWFNLELHT